MASMFISVSVVFAVLVVSMVLVVPIVLVVTEVSLLHTWFSSFPRGWLLSSSGSPWSRSSRDSLGWCVFLCSVVLVVSVVLDVLVVPVVGVVTIRCSFSAVDQSDSEDDYCTIC